MQARQMPVCGQHGQHGWDYTRPQVRGCPDPSSIAARPAQTPLLPHQMTGLSSDAHDQTAVLLIRLCQTGPPLAEESEKTGLCQPALFAFSVQKTG